MRRILLGIAAMLLVFAAGVYLWNASWRAAPPPDPQVLLIAHRGVHQTFNREGLENDTCTATRIFPPSHPYLENTIASMEAAFAAGADIVELDVHPTTDGEFAVFHDWTLDCRTQGTGDTRGHAMPALKAMDVGYGYTADDGANFPFRGKGIGLMPTFADVMAALPTGRFLVNYKSNEVHEGDMLADMVAAHSGWRERVWGAYGGDLPTLRAAGRMPGLNVWSRRGLVDCLSRYLAVGWTGHVPQSCRNTKVMVPINLAWLLWGWPNLFLQRMGENGSEVILMGPYGVGDPGTAGIDDLDTLAQVPAEFSGYVWTNRIEVIGPALGRGTGKPAATLQ